MRPSIGDQARRLSKLCPGWRTVYQSTWVGVWEGIVRTPMREYRVRVQFVRSNRLDSVWVTSRINPRVWVVEPTLRMHAGATRLPHAYSDDADHPIRWPLCLYFAPDDEWTEADWIADSIVPWAAEWLLFYEGWLVTGVWHGGGLHVGDAEFEAWRLSQKERRLSLPDQAGPYNRGADNKIGRRTGSFVSSALMAAASRGFSPPLSLRDWNLCIWQDED